MKNAPENSARKVSIKVFGIGGAGCNAISSIAQTPSVGLETIAVNTDSQSLANCIATEKFCLGSKVTHGMGTGGDSELGRAAAEADAEQLKEFCEGANIVFILTGLGGGTGTAASSIVAQAAKDSGALVLGIVTTPFEFEGGRRQRQAQLGLQQLRAIADAVICLPNGKLFNLVNAKTTVLDAFKMANDTLTQGVLGISRLLTQTGLINVDFADLCATTRNLHAESSFATAEGSGENRVEEIIAKLSVHPMLEGGELLANSESLLVSLAGGLDLTMVEVNRVMKEINNRSENARVIFGALIDDSFANRLSVTLIASGKSSHEEKTVSAIRTSRTSNASAQSEPDSQLLSSTSNLRPSSRIVAPAPQMSEEKKGELLTKQTGSRQKKSGSRMRQNELPLEIISKGRFEKSEPTIYHGEDLDLPTYIRRGIALN